MGPTLAVAVALAFAGAVAPAPDSVCQNPQSTPPPSIAVTSGRLILFDGKAGNPAADSALVCNDGTPAGFYIDDSPCTGTSKQCSNWQIHLQGGGDCHDNAACFTRATLDPSSDDWNLLSSDRAGGRTTRFTPVLAFGQNSEASGIMAPDARVSPLWNYNRIFVPYCSSDVFSGDRAGTLNPATSNIHDPNIYAACVRTNNCAASEPKAPSTLWHFPGKRIFNAAVQYAITHYPEFGTARTVFSGSSAGAFGVTLQMDNLKQRLVSAQRNGELLGIADSGWLPLTEPQVPGVESPTWTMWSGEGQSDGGPPQADETCLAHLVPGEPKSNCQMLAKFIMPWIEGGRMFARRAQYDHNRNPGSPSDCAAGGDGGKAADQWATALASEMVSTARFAHGTTLPTVTVGLTAVYAPGIVVGNGWCSALSAPSAQDPMWTEHTTMQDNSKLFGDSLVCTATTPAYSVLDALNDFLSGKAVVKVRGASARRRHAVQH